jgi:hypothetical protein
LSRVQQIKARRVSRGRRLGLRYHRRAGHSTNGLGLGPFLPSEKFLLDGKVQDFGEIVKIDMTRVPARFKQ